jgi:tripartite-type tricarboxylate transporter receptor subunit TctC
MIVPFPAGGPTDLVARVIGQKMAESMGQQIIIENRPGANSNLGAAYVAKAAPDGYTLLYNTSAVTLSPSLYKNMPYDLERDLAPVALTAVVPLALVIANNVPGEHGPGVHRICQGEPGQTVVWLGRCRQRHPPRRVPVRAGHRHRCRPRAVQGQRARRHRSGRRPDPVHDGNDQLGDGVRQGQAHQAAGRDDAEAHLVVPRRPTLSELGIKGSEAGAWQGLMVPAKTPKPVIDKLNAEVMKALQSADVRSRLAQQGTEPLGSTPEEYADLHQERDGPLGQGRQADRGDARLAPARCSNRCR